MLRKLKKKIKKQCIEKEAVYRNHLINPKPLPKPKDVRVIAYPAYKHFESPSQYRCWQPPKNKKIDPNMPDGLNGSRIIGTYFTQFTTKEEYPTYKSGIIL